MTPPRYPDTTAIGNADDVSDTIWGRSSSNPASHLMLLGNSRLDVKELAASTMSGNVV